MNLFIRLILLSPLFFTTFSREIPKFDEFQTNSMNIDKRQLWKRVAVSNPDKLWDEAVIPYTIYSNCSESLHKTIYRAIEQWESKTCIKFVPAEPNHYYRLNINNAGGNCHCCAPVGKTTGKPPAVFRDGCNYLPIVLHELGHAIGFFHEQARPDRDDYVKILFQNVKKGHEYNFRKLDKSVATTLGLAYDFDSIMHYQSHTFGVEGKTTIVAVNDSFRVPQSRITKLSETDIIAANKLYKCPKCFIRPTRKIGTISLPENFKETYCQWYIKRNPGEFIEFFIENVDIPESKNCADNYVEFRDGYWSRSPLIVQLCGTAHSRKYYKTKSSHLLITYMASSEYSKIRNFSVTYRVICNGTINAEAGRIQSPEFNQPYSFDSICQWVITVPSGYKAALMFETFHTAYDENCQSDYVEVSEGSINSNKLLGRFCGNIKPNDIVSSSNTLIVRFASEKRKFGSGFSATFTKEINECELPDKGGCSDICVNTLGSYYCECSKGKQMFPNWESCEKYIESCGGSVNATERVVIVSPSYPNKYPSNSNCTWNIINENVRLRFLDMNIDKIKGKCGDKLILSTYTIRKEYCGYNRLALTLRQAKDLKLQFISDAKREKKGFALLVETF